MFLAVVLFLRLHSDSTFIQVNTHTMKTFFVLLMLLLCTGSYADNHTAGDYQKVRHALGQLLPGLTDFEIRPASIDKLLEVRSDSSVFYVSTDGEFLLNGPLYRLEQGENLTEKRLAEHRKNLLAKIPALQPIVYPAGNSRHRVTVITDIDCPYCRRLHQEMAAYHAVGLDIQYLMLPRAGKDSPSYAKTVDALCARQPAQAITAAMNGAVPEPADCPHGLDQHMAMARDLGVTSTPNILLADGTLIRGYKTAAELVAILAAAVVGGQSGSVGKP